MSDNKIQDLIQRTRSELPVGTPTEQIRGIIERPDAEGFVQSLEPLLLFQLINQAGFDDAIDLIPLASPWQIQVFVDLDVWHKDRFQADKLIPWLTILVEQTDDAKFKAIARETDPETFAMFFKDGLLVGLFDEDGDPPPEMASLQWELSPDGVYAIVYPADEEKAAVIRQILDRLYHVDRVLAWTLLEAVRWELATSMEEEAYRWRTSRLEEFGFVSRDEALELYKSVNPAKVRAQVDDGVYQPKDIERVRASTLPLALDTDESEQFFLRVMNALPENDLEPVLTEFVAVQNRAMLADGVEPGELDRAPEVGRRTVGYMSLGLEYLSRADEIKAGEILRTVALSQVFRVGFSLTWRLRKTVVDLRRRPTLTMVEGQFFSLLRGDDRALCEAIFKVRPAYSPSLGMVEPFEHQRQVDDAALRLATIAFKQLWLFGAAAIKPDALIKLGYGEALANSPDEISFDTVFATHVVLALLQKKPAARGLSVDELNRLPAILRGRPWGDDPLAYFEEETVAPVLENLPPTSLRFVGPWLRRTLDELTDELERISGEITEPGMFRHVLLISA